LSAAEAMGLTADRLRTLGLVDELIAEPLGGAHRNPAVIASSVKDAIARQLRELRAKSRETLLAERSRRIAGFGVFTEEPG
jgi:acetyl-CoA carboxylase carboxyl transferase subunit alpha